MKKLTKEDISRYPLLVASAVVAVLALLVWAFGHTDEPQEEVVPEDVTVNDTLALNILCTPTLESLPFYYAVESGLTDSLGLPLVIRTEMAQFDVDSIMMRTKRIDGAVLDLTRLAQYKKRMPALTQSIALDGTWRLLTSGKLRLRSVEKLKKRTVATARFATSDDCLREALRGSGVAYDALYHAQINDYSILQNMLDEAQVDACVLPEPFATAAQLRGHRVVWSNDSVRNLVLCFRDKALKKPLKKQQVELLTKVYNRACDSLNRRSGHAADSTLIKAYNLSPEVVDSLRLPKYHKVKVKK